MGNADAGGAESMIRAVPHEYEHIVARRGPSSYSAPKQAQCVPPAESAAEPGDGESGKRPVSASRIAGGGEHHTAGQRPPAVAGYAMADLYPRHAELPRDGSGHQSGNICAHRVSLIGVRRFSDSFNQAYG
jgi:hypothetical protein